MTTNKKTLELRNIKVKPTFLGDYMLIYNPLAKCSQNIRNFKPMDTVTSKGGQKYLCAPNGNFLRLPDEIKKEKTT